MVHSERFSIAADKLIAEFTDDRRLQDLLAYLNPLYGGVAGHTPAYIHALINVLYINGATRFAGGSQQLADRLSDLIRSNGGEVHTNHEVTEIRVEDRTICEIVTKSGSFKSEKYISAVHPCELLRLLPEKVFPKSYRTRLQEIPNSNSAFSLFIKLRSGSFPYINHTCYYQDDYGDVWHHTTYNPNRWPKGFMYMTPPDENQGEYAERMLINCIMDFEPVKRWEETRVGHRGKEYELWKQELTDRILERMEDLRPGFKQCVESVYAASPLTIRDFYHTKEGAIFGYRKDCENILLSQVPIYTKISNLLLTGQNINLHGICGVPLTAINTAEALLGRNAVINKINECYV
jgi:all-trans-retinol 13,14-reductase